MIAGKKMILVEITVYTIPHNYSFLCELISTKFWKYRCFSKVTKLHHICTLHVHYTQKIDSDSKLLQIQQDLTLKYHQWASNFHCPVHQTQCILIWACQYTFQLIYKFSTDYNFFSLNADRRILWSHKG